MLLVQGNWKLSKCQNVTGFFLIIYNDNYLVCCKMMEGKYTL